MIYNWQQDDWPKFRYEEGTLTEKLLLFAQNAGKISGLVQGLSPDQQTEMIIRSLVAEALKTSEIEGEYMSREDVMSSVRNRLGLTPQLPHVKDHRAKGVAEMLLNVRDAYHKPLSQTMLFAWHNRLMQGNQYIKAGQWRKGEEPMQIVSGAIGKEKVHFEAPPSERVPSEMKQFIDWFNRSAPGKKAALPKTPVRSALAHLYFESIHPFEDGNGRIGRAIAEKALSQAIGWPGLMGLSNSIEANKSAYYNALKKAQRSNEITSWLIWFVDIVLQSQNAIEKQIQFSLQVARLFDKHADVLNERQAKALRKMIDAGSDQFEGEMNARKYISITRSSKATATRDLQRLVELGIFIHVGAGRSVRYELNLSSSS